MKMGIFEMRGGAAANPELQIGGPIFDKITIKLNPGYYKRGKFVIEAVNNSNKNRYIQDIKLNGRKYDKIWLYHNDIVDGGAIKLEIIKVPNQSQINNLKIWPSSVNR
ncbi:MAG: putative alpha-1,2-mannosidase [Saprospiraceae bacterium]|jgi:putative alpha-1,2-mannosidase